MGRGTSMMDSPYLGTAVMISEFAREENSVGEVSQAVGAAELVAGTRAIRVCPGFGVGWDWRV